jgi:hypothetical protein
VTPALRAAAVGVALLLGAGVVLGSRVPFGAAPEAAVVRMSWRAVGRHVESCRAPTEAELAGVPEHMRQKEICERRLLPFRLVLRVDGAPALDELVRPSGARHDRPSYVFRELPVPSGSHRIEVRFGEEGATEPAPPLELDATVALAPGAVALVTRVGDEGDRLAIELPPP